MENLVNANGGNHQTHDRDAISGDAHPRINLQEIRKKPFGIVYTNAEHRLQEYTEIIRAERWERYRLCQKYSHVIMFPL